MGGGVMQGAKSARIAEQRGAIRGARAAFRLACVLPLAAVIVLATAAGSAAQQQAPDTTAADTVPTARERALERLRALPTSPIQRDTAAADTLPGDTLAADTLAADTLAADTAGAGVGEPGAGPQIFLADTVPGADAPLREDSLLALLRGLAGYEVTEYEAEAAVFEAGADRLRLSGTSRVGRGRNALRSDSLLVYSGSTGVVCGYGNPVLEGERDPVESRRVCYDIERDLGMAEAARTRFAQGATWYVRGADNRVYLLTGEEDTELYGEKTEFTSCDLPEPHYTFRARSLKMREGDVMIARDVTLRFEDVPVFWLPWMVQSMKRDRQSGLLMPQFGANDIVRNQSGYNRHISNLGFYWAINDYMSARTSYEWFSGNWQAVTGALSYRWLRQFLNGGVTFTRYWRESGARDLSIATSNSWQPDERTRVTVSGNYASSTDFVRRNSFSPRELNRNLRMAGGLQRSFDWGNISTSASRTQHLTTDRIETELPSVSLSLSPITLYSSAGGANQLTWSGSAALDRRLVDVPDTSAAGLRDTQARTASVSHRVGFGRFSISQSAGYADDLTIRRPALLDEDGGIVAPGLAGRRAERLTWRSQASYQQGLWTGTTVTPNVSITGGALRQTPSPEFADAVVAPPGEFVDEPGRLSFGAGLNTSVYGFWPGFGPFSRIRHKISPSLGWSYSPQPETTPLQDSIFGIRNLRRQNRLTLSFNQTFEAKYAEGDTAMADTATGQPGEPRRLPQARKITLLALNTGTSFLYDFVAAEEEGRGFLTDEVSNSIRSDLLRGFQLTTTHDLFREEQAAQTTTPRSAIPGTPPPPRTFAPFLTRLSANFSIDNDFWLFRALGLSGGAPAAVDTMDDGFQDEGAEGPAGSLDPAIGAEAEPNQQPGGVGSIVTGRGPPSERIRSGTGGWNASLSYSLVRRRPGTAARSENQMLSGNFSFQPTEHWRVTWRTGYSFTAGEFSDHMLTLTRDLHRWQANFDFIKAQNGNFAFSFRVNLIDNPDLKLDYDQRTDPSESGLRDARR